MDFSAYPVDSQVQNCCNRYTVVHDFNGHEVNGIHGLNGKKCYDKALYLVNNRHDFKGMHDFKGNFPYDYFFHKTHARLYFPDRGH